MVAGYDRWGLVKFGEVCEFCEMKMKAFYFLIDFVEAVPGMAAVEDHNIVVEEDHNIVVEVYLDT